MVSLNFQVFGGGNRFDSLDTPANRTVFSGRPLNVPRTSGEATASVPLSGVTVAMVPRSACANASLNIGGAARVEG
jgi:hypothetical protein